MNENALYRERKQNQRRTEIGVRVLENARTELYLNVRFLDVALSSLKYVPETGIHPAGTDGGNLFFCPEELIGLFQTDRRRVNRLYLHMLMHCLFGHLFADPEYNGSSGYSETEDDEC